MRAFYFILLLFVGTNSYGSQSISKSYTLSICSVKNLENSFTCIDRSLKECKKLFVIWDKDQNIYRVNCGVFSTYKEAKQFEKTFVTEAIKYNGPFVKSYSFNIAEYETFISSNEAIDISSKLSNLNNLSKEKYIDQLTESFAK